MIEYEIEEGKLVLVCEHRLVSYRHRYNSTVGLEYLTKEERTKLLNMQFCNKCGRGFEPSPEGDNEKEDV